MILLCPICDKPFGKESSHKRHISYCRRNQARSRVRPRSCRSCNAAKVKCTFRSPCLRCTDKGLECIYEVSSRAAVALQDREPGPANTVDGSANVDVSALDAIPAHQGSGNSLAQPTEAVDVGLNASRLLDLSGTTATLEDILSSADMHTGFASGTFNYGYDSHVPSSNMLSTPLLDQQIQQSSPPSLMWLPTSIQPRMGHMAQAPWSAWTSSVTLDPKRLTPELNNALSFTQGLIPTLQLIPATSAVVQHSSRLILQGLRAYPLMMLRRETLPPFIHPHWHRQAAPSLPEPLSSCMSIAHMYAFRSEETKPFLWRTVQAEDERFLAQRKSMSPEDLLACIQAQMIYMIMRFVDGSHDPPELNQQLIRTYQMLCKRFRYIHNGIFCEPDQFILRPSWEEWIDAESRRRTACVFFLICRCISITTGIEGCDVFHEFSGLPLASPKTLWEAKTRADWEEEYSAYRAVCDTGIHTIGMLISAHERSDDPAKAGLLDLWNARTDNLGELLNVVTSMV